MNDRKIRVVDVRTGKKVTLDSTKTVLKAERSEQGIRLSGTAVIEDYKSSIGIKKVDWDCHVDPRDLAEVESWAVGSDYKLQRLWRADGAYEMLSDDIDSKWQEIKMQAHERYCEISSIFDEVKKEVA
jgi:hypothetical protein